MAQAEKPNLVILDLVMLGLNSREVCHGLNEGSTTDIPMLVLTVKGQVGSRTGTKEQTDGFDARAVDFFSQPVKTQELVERVNALLCLT